MAIRTRVLFALLVLPPAFELAVRFDDWLRYGVAFSSRASSIEDLQEVDSLGRHGRPNAVYRKFRINALGFRGPEVRPTDISVRPLIVVSGSSETFGLYESDGKEWPRQLSDSLAKVCANQPVTVLNAGFAGMSMPTVVQDLKLRILPMKPRVIVYHPQPAQDLDRTSPEASAITAHASAPPSAWHLRAGPQVRDEIKRAIPDALLDWLRRLDTERSRREQYPLFASLPIERLDTLEAQLRLMVGTVRRSGAVIVVVLPKNRFDDTTSIDEQRWLRAWERFVPRATAALFLDFSARANERIQRVARDSTVPLIDPVFPRGRARSLMFADPVHYSDLGASIMAAASTGILANVLSCSQ